MCSYNEPTDDAERGGRVEFLLPSTVLDTYDCMSFVLCRVVLCCDCIASAFCITGPLLVDSLLMELAC